MFVSSHLISEVAITAERVVVIGAGRLLADTSVAELSARTTSLEAAFLELTAFTDEFRTAPHPDRLSDPGDGRRDRANAPTPL